MPLYRYVAVNRSGKQEKGIVNASNARSARQQLKGKGLYVRNLSEDTEKKDRELFPFLSKILYRVPRREVGLFARQLGTLLGAGLSLDRSLQNIIEQVQNVYLKKALVEIESSIKEGDNLSTALRKHPAIFPPIYYNLISIGEQTGAYEQALLRLADLENANETLKNKISTAMAYPIFMMVLMGGIMIFLLAVVFPQIQDLFKQMDAELPMITKIVIAISNVLSTWRVFIPIGIVIGGTFLFFDWKKTEKGRDTWENFVLKTPFLGGFVRKIILARFARNLAVLLKSRVPLITSMQVVAKVVNHQTFEREIGRAINRIKEGTKITDSLRDSIIINQMMLGMISAGELSDSIPDMVEKIADIFENDVNTNIDRLSTLMEPLMMLFMGGMIGIIMAAILLPMYNLTSQM